MFRRPSLADMLAVPEPGVVPPAGGVRVAKSVATEEANAAPAVEAPADSPPLAIDSEADTLLNEDTVLDEVDDNLDTLLDDPEDVMDTDLREPDDEFSFGSPAIKVPVSSIAVDVPDPSEVPDVEPTDAPPGFEKPNRSLDDSWFGEEDEFEGEEATQPIGEGFIEDPGFADVTEPSGVDDIPWADASSGAPPFPKGMVLGAVGLVAAVVLAFFMMSGEKTAPDVAPQPTVVQTQAPPPRVAPPPPPPVPAEVEELAPEDLEPVEVVETSEEKAPPAAAPPPERTTASVPPKPKVKPRVAAAKSSKSRRKPKTSDNPWASGKAKSKSAAPAPAPAPAANPWGAPEAAKRGRINITSNVKARVFLDGKNIGNTPTSTEADFGPHTLRAEVKGYQGQTKTVNVQSGEIKVPFTLRVAAAMGRCNLLGTPGDSVVMDGKSVGKLPQIVECAAGKHSFKVTPGDGGAPYTKSMGSSGDFTTIMLRR